MPCTIALLIGSVTMCVIVCVDFLLLYAIFFFWQGIQFLKTFRMPIKFKSSKEKVEELAENPLVSLPTSKIFVALQNISRIYFGEMSRPKYQSMM
jgi:hypothetical protein